MWNQIKRSLSITIFSLALCGLFPWTVFAQTSQESVALTGDAVQYSVDGNKITADGHVEVVYKGSTLTCDQIEFFRDSKIAHATGHVRLTTKTGEISGNKLNFNFETMTGDFNGARIISSPIYGAGEKISKVSEDLLFVENGHLTTCDYDKPHYRFTAKKLDVYPGDKLVARKVVLKVGKVPLMYFPRFTQSLKDKKPRVILTPGYDKEWGMFLLSQWRYYFNENFKGTIHVDARERKDIASGIDLQYKSADFGEGVIRTYYMNERSITSKRFYQERPSPTIEKERFKVQWRHKWEIDKDTRAIAQYYKLSDATFLKDYFEREYEKDSSTKTYFLLTHRLWEGTLSFRTDARVNRFKSAVERLPEIQYNLSSKEIGDTGLYFSNTSTYSNLTEKTASPSEVRQNTMRVNTDSRISYPMKVGFIDINPYVGGQQTYYSKTKDTDKYNTIRGIFRTGASLSTKFYRIFDVSFDKWGMEVNRLRHIITPSVSYKYQHEPTMRAEFLDSYDSIDDLGYAHSMTFGLENKLQTKRNDQTVDLLRAKISAPYNLDNNGSRARVLGDITTDIDFKPLAGATFYFDSIYDAKRDHLKTANFDLYINEDVGRWTLSLGKRWHRDVDDQLTASFKYKINPKWTIELYDRFDLEKGLQKEQQVILTRDLHAWKMDMVFNETKGEGDEILIVFTLKAFPEIGFDMGTSFNKRKAGSQSR